MLLEIMMGQEREAGLQEGLQRGLQQGRDAGSLYPKVRRDAAIICCILQGFNLRDTDDFLVSVGERSFL